MPLRVLVPFAVGYVASFVVAGLGDLRLRALDLPVHADCDSRVLTSYAIGYSAAVLAFFVSGGLGARDGATATALAAVDADQRRRRGRDRRPAGTDLVELGYAGCCEVLHRRRVRSAGSDLGGPASARRR